MTTFDAPIPLSDLESVLAWVDTFKLSRPTKKINRDFSDAVLLAEMLSVHYPKLVEMHNYPPRNSHALKLNNWMTLNRKVLKKLRLNLCCTTMEQLANCAPGIVERVLIMVRDKIRRDEEINKIKDGEQNVSSGGSYYEACGDDEHVLVVPVKTRVNGVLETIQQKVVNHEAYVSLKEELKDAKDSIEVLKQKVEHLDNLLKLKDIRIDELQKQLERKQIRRKEAEAYVNSLAVPFDASLPPSPTLDEIANVSSKTSLKAAELIRKISQAEESKTPTRVYSHTIIKPQIYNDSKSDEIKDIRSEECKVPLPNDYSNINPVNSKPSITEVHSVAFEIVDDINYEVDRIKSDVFKEIETIEQKGSDRYIDVDEFKDSENESITTIEGSIQREIIEIASPINFENDLTYIK